MHSFRAFAQGKATWILNYSWDGDKKIAPPEPMMNLAMSQVMAGANFWDAATHVMSGSNDLPTRKRIFEWIEKHEKTPVRAARACPSDRRLLLADDTELLSRRVPALLPGHPDPAAAEAPGVPGRDAANPGGVSGRDPRAPGRADARRGRARRAPRAGLPRGATRGHRHGRDRPPRFGCADAIPGMSRASLPGRPGEGLREGGSFARPRVSSRP